MTLAPVYTAEFFFRDKKGMLEDEETMLSDQAHPTLESTPTKSYWVNVSSECAHFCKHTMTFTTNKHSYKVCKEFIEVHDELHIPHSHDFTSTKLCRPITLSLIYLIPRQRTRHRCISSALRLLGQFNARKQEDEKMNGRMKVSCPSPEFTSS